MKLYFCSIKKIKVIENVRGLNVSFHIIHSKTKIAL